LSKERLQIIEFLFASNVFGYHLIWCQIRAG
jgi:hypothetical protein